MKRFGFRMITVLLAVLMTVALCGCEVEVAVATLPQQGTTVTTVTTANGDQWDGAGKLTTVATTTTTVATLPSTTEKAYQTLATIAHDAKYVNDYGIYHVLKGYCFGKVYSLAEWLPVVGYVKDGKIVDALYTATTIMPSPVNTYWGDFNTKAEWDAWREHTYKNLDTLNEAAGEVQKALSLKEHKIKVFLTLVNPQNAADNPTYYDNWGSLDGTTMDVSNNEHRLTMLRYMVDSYLSEFAAKGYENVELAGFYWFDEYVVQDDLSFYQSFTDYIRSKGKITMISPYYKATGWTLCGDAGFDLHSMQSNYFPTMKIGSMNCGSDKRLPANAALINNGQIGGIEMEMDSHDVKDAITGWKKTMKVGVETGIVNGYHVHYFGGGPGSPYALATSTDPYFRSCYDELYKYMHNTLTVSEIWLDPIEKEQEIMDGASDWV